MKTTPGIYRHHKGGLYTVLFVALNSTNGADHEPVVVYVSHTTGNICVRDEKEFHEMVPILGEAPDAMLMGPRFAAVAT